MTTASMLALVVFVVPSAQARPQIGSPTYSFGELQGGRAAIVGVQVNAVDEPTTIESVELLDPGSPFWIEGEDCIDDPMDVNNVCHIAVVYLAPDVDGSFQDTLRVQAEDGTTATSVVQGSSYRAGGLTADPARVDWASRADWVPTLPISRSVVLRNRTAEPLWIDSVTATPGFSVQNRPLMTGCAEEVLPGDTCSVSVLPPSSRTGVTEGALIVRYARAYGDYPGPFTPLLPYSTLSVPLTRTPSSPRLPITVPKKSKGPNPGPIRAGMAKISTSIPRLVRGGPSGFVSLPAFKAPVSGRLSLVLHGWRRGKRVWIGGGDHTFEHAGKARLRLRLNKTGLALLRRPQRSQIKILLEFSPPEGRDIRHSSQRRVKPPLKKRIERR